MGHQLEDIKPRRVSLVKRGANLRRILLAKSDEENLDGFVADMLAAPVEKEDGLLDAVRASNGDESVEKAASTVARAIVALRSAYDGQLPDPVRKAMNLMADDDGDDDTEPDDDENVEKAHAAEHAIYKRDFTADQRRDLAKKGHALADGSYPIETKADIGPALTLAQSGHGDAAAAKTLIKRRASELGANDQLPDEWVNKEERMTETAQAVPVKKEDGSWDFSAVPEEQRAPFELLVKQHDDELAELRKAAEVEASKAENAEKIAKAVEEKLETAEYIAKSAELSHLAKSDDEFGPVLREIAKAEQAGHVSEGTAAKLDQVLKAADEAVAKGDLFTEMGRTGHGTGSDGEQKLDAAAAELRKADPNLSEAQAIAKALENDPSLYDDIRKEQ